MKRFDLKSLVVGGLVVAAACVAMGMMDSREPAPQVGRFQIDCAQNTCYMVDTATGQAWASHDPAFFKPKIKSPEERVATATKSFAGRWTALDPDQQEVAITFNADGTLVAGEANDSKTFSGTWQTEGDRIKFNVDNANYTGELTAAGQLVITEDNNTKEKLTFKREK